MNPLDSKSPKSNNRYGTLVEFSDHSDNSMGSLYDSSGGEEDSEDEVRVKNKKRKAYSK